MTPPQQPAPYWSARLQSVAAFQRWSHRKPAGRKVPQHRRPTSTARKRKVYRWLVGKQVVTDTAFAGVPEISCYPVRSIAGRARRGQVRQPDVECVSSGNGGDRASGNANHRPAPPVKHGRLLCIRVHESKSAIHVGLGQLDRTLAHAKPGGQTGQVHYQRPQPSSSRSPLPGLHCLRGS